MRNPGLHRRRFLLSGAAVGAALPFGLRPAAAQTLPAGTIRAIIPFAAEAMALAVGETYPPTWPSTDARSELSRLPAGRRISVPPVLFRKIEEADVVAWSARFGGAE